MKKRKNPKTQFYKGGTVIVANTANRPFLKHTIGAVGTLEKGPKKTFIVHILGLGQFTFPLTALKPLNAYQ